MNFFQYLSIFEAGIIVILFIMVLIMGFIIKRKNNEEKRIFNQKLLDREEFKRTLKTKKGFYDDKAKKATNINDLLDLTDKLLQDGYH